MENVDDPIKPLSRIAVIAAIKSEREYQKRRWGVRQPDGSFVEVPHDAYDYLCYMYHYNIKAIEASATLEGNKVALELFRKVVTLGVAYFELKGEGVDEGYMRAINNVKAGSPFYLLKAQREILNGIENVNEYSISGLEANIFAVIEIGFSCFERFGIQPRDLSNITNGRDSLPA
jgi:hypothetical protein